MQSCGANSVSMNNGALGSSSIMMRSEEESRDEVMKAATSTADDVLG